MRPTLFLTVAVFAATCCLRLDARQRGASGPPPQIIPAAVNSIAANADAYVGATVSLTAAVERSLSPTAFVLRQTPGKETLAVIAPTLNAPVTPGAYVTVLGTLIRYRPADLATRAHDYTPDFDDAIPADTPVVIATSVLTTAMADLARKMPPPLPPDELEFQGVMKRVGPAFNGLRAAADTANADEARTHVATLKKGFEDIAPFWKNHAKADAQKWAADAGRETDAAAAALQRGDWEAVKAAAGRLNQVCQACHGVYRERLEDGTSRIKNLAR